MVFIELNHDYHYLLNESATKMRMVVQKQCDNDTGDANDNDTNSIVRKECR